MRRSLCGNQRGSRWLLALHGRVVAAAAAKSIRHLGTSVSDDSSDCNHQWCVFQIMIPPLQEYLAADSSPEAVLVTGWSEPGFMGQLLWELDQGQSALPPGEKLTLSVHLKVAASAGTAACLLKAWGVFSKTAAAAGVCHVGLAVRTMCLQHVKYSQIAACR